MNSQRAGGLGVPFRSHDWPRSANTPGRHIEAQGRNMAVRALPLYAARVVVWTLAVDLWTGAGSPLTFRM